jgi:two-component system LytT family sensor kinase
MHRKFLQNLSAHRIEVLVHIIIWSPFLGALIIQPNSSAPQRAIFTAFLLVAFYTNILILIPSLFKKKKWFSYFISLIMVLLVTNALRSLSLLLYFVAINAEFDFKKEFVRWMFLEYRSFDRFVFSPNSWMIYLSFTYMLIKDWLANEQIKSRLTAERDTMELAFLKSQVNPHFLFNTLNNVYALALEERAQRTSEAVTQLGALMRYNLHDSQADYIFLSKEIDYIEKYIELQKLRIANQENISLKVNFDIDELKSQKIAPMILLPMIENAFKYGVSAVKASLIQISLGITGDTVTLEVKNSKNNTNGQEGGIGLKNLRTRLKSLYAGKHSFDTADDENYYTANLKIIL